MVRGGRRRPDLEDPPTMLFNSYVFIFGFLPACLVGFYGLAGYSRQGAKVFLIVASFAFYGWWNVQYVPLLAGSVLFNYWAGRQIQDAILAQRAITVKYWRNFGIAANIALLGYFKYTNFFIDNVNVVLGTEFTLHHIILPLGISFFTFQKIAYLIDSARGQIKKNTLPGFALFAVFFPQLISGPIVRYDEVYPQFETRLFSSQAKRNIMIGLVIFAIGLFKKTVIADTAGGIATPLFDAAANGALFTVSTGWVAAATYTVQLYFDFSGYSDMAIGLGRMFGIALPLNFHSPLRASNIIDYWRRWHMTLQRFMVSYLYQPLSLAFARRAAASGLNRWPTFFISVAMPAFLTFVIIGIWHGAGWTFVLFGVIHAGYVCTNEAWREYQKQRRRRLKLPAHDTAQNPTLFLLFNVLTIFCVMIANVVFRSDRIVTAGVILRGMFGFSGAAGEGPEIPPVPLLLTFMMLAVLIIAVMPNTQQIMRWYRPAVNWRQWRDVSPPLVNFYWRPNAIGIIAAGILLFLGLAFIQRGEVAFLYFNF
jgi:alginate O-acetyltransferase complex protein AlgI